MPDDILTPIEGTGSYQPSITATGSYQPIISGTGSSDTVEAGPDGVPLSQED